MNPAPPAARFALGIEVLQAGRLRRYPNRRSPRPGAASRAEHPALAPIDHDAADGGIGADRQFGIVRPLGPHHLKTKLLHALANLVQPHTFKLVVVEAGRADQELEPPMIFHPRPAPTRTDGRDATAPGGRRRMKLLQTRRRSEAGTRTDPDSAEAVTSPINPGRAGAIRHHNLQRPG